MPLRDKVTREFFSAYYKSNVWKYRTFWRGVRVLKCPFDMWLYQQLIYQLRADLIIELGTYMGGSALYLADMQRLAGLKGNVVTVDVIDVSDRPDDPAITYIMGSSTAYNVVRQIRKMAESADTVMVIADSAHDEKHVLRELQLYYKMITPGSYYIVEDGTANIQVDGEPNPGPSGAIAKFLSNHKQFEQDNECEQFLLTFNAGGFLRRKP